MTSWLSQSWAVRLLTCSIDDGAAAINLHTLYVMAAGTAEALGHQQLQYQQQFC